MISKKSFTVSTSHFAPSERALSVKIVVGTLFLERLDAKPRQTDEMPPPSLLMSATRNLPIPHLLQMHAYTEDLSVGLIKEKCINIVFLNEGFKKTQVEVSFRPISINDF